MGTKRGAEEEKGMRSGSGVERHNREVERGKGRGGGEMAERENREVERGSGGRGDGGNSIMGCRTSTEDRRASGRSVLKDGRGVGRREERTERVSTWWGHGGGNAYRQGGRDTDAKWK